MDVQLRDEAAQDRLRAATEFLDPSESCDRVAQRTKLTWDFLPVDARARRFVESTRLLETHF